MAREAGRKGGQASGASRRRKAAFIAPWRGTILDLMDLAGMSGPTWAAWRAFWRVVYALRMDASELELFRTHTGREQPPAQPVSEAWMVIGRGGGKTRNSALNAVYRAITHDRSSVAPGEDTVVPLLASDRRQARAALSYVGAFNALGEVLPYVFGEAKEVIAYKSGLTLEVATASKSATRGFASPSACADEIAWWQSPEDGANPDHEVLTALRGSLGRVHDSLLVVLSNPAAPKGELHAAVQDFYGVDDPDVLIWNAATLAMNPTYSRKAIERAFKRDPAVALSEFGQDGHVAFRQAKQAMFDADAVAQCIVTERRELPPAPDVTFIAFCDASQGQRSGDPMTLAIAHLDGSRAVLDVLREVQPPFDPAHVVRDFADLCAAYRVHAITGDRVSIGFVLHEFEAAGIRFTPATLSKSDLFAELLPLINTGRVELLDHPTLRAQLVSLERRAMRGGKDSIDHPRGMHDDVANAAAGALVLAAGITGKVKRRVIAGFGGLYMGLHRIGSPEASRAPLPAPTPVKRVRFAVGGGER